MWQDIIISIGGVFFTIALIPSLLSQDKPALTTSVMTSSILFILVFTYASLGLWLSSLMNAIMCLLWATLAVQKLRLKSDLPGTKDTPSKLPNKSE